VHYVKAKGILSSHNGMNLYRGCTHGCIYCDSRSSCYRMDHSFEDIEVKENALELLEDALRRKRKRCMIGTGSMSDPYIPLELKTEYTRKALLIIEKYGCGVAALIIHPDHSTLSPKERVRPLYISSIARFCQSKAYYR